MLIGCCIKTEVGFHTTLKYNARGKLLSQITTFPILCSNEKISAFKILRKLRKLRNISYYNYHKTFTSIGIYVGILQYLFIYKLSKH